MTLSIEDIERVQRELKNEKGAVLDTCIPPICMLDRCKHLTLHRTSIRCVWSDKE